MKDVGIEVECEYEPTQGEPSDGESNEVIDPLIFRIEELIGYSITCCEKIESISEQEYPKEQEEVIPFEVEDQQAKREKIKHPFKALFSGYVSGCVQCLDGIACTLQKLIHLSTRSLTKIFALSC